MEGDILVNENNTTCTSTVEKPVHDRPNLTSRSKNLRLTHQKFLIVDTDSWAFQSPHGSSCHSINSDEAGRFRGNFADYHTRTKNTRMAPLIDQSIQHSGRKTRKATFTLDKSIEE